LSLSQGSRCYSVVRNYLEEHRPAPAPLAPPPPTVRDVTGWLTRHPDSLTEDERPGLPLLRKRVLLTAQHR
jgi:hypothetical protein